jgi:uncharacterized OB-fold protein
MLAPDLFETDGPLEPGAPVRLVASFCPVCSRYQFPRRDNCPQCGRAAETTTLADRATVSQCTAVLYPPPDALVEVPYLVAVADFPGGLSVLGLVSREHAPGDIALGDTVCTIAAEVGDRLGFCYRLAGA